MLSLKYISLGILIVQNTAHVLTIRYSRTRKTHANKYLPSTVVVMAETMKVLTSLLILCSQNDWSSTKVYLQVNKWTDGWRLAIPSALYVLQNNLLYIALSNLDAATFQITYQIKILTTAIFAVVLLGKRLSIIQWLSLIMLMIGVALIQLPSVNSTVPNDTSVRSLGIWAILCACLSSGFAGVYFEKILKGSSQSIWIRNIQLGIFGIIFGVVSVFFYDAQSVTDYGFFQGYDHIIWIIISLQAFGGLVVAIVIKYADNILKSFAASISIILSTVFSYYLLNDLVISRLFVIGASLVVSSVFIYGFKLPENLIKSNQKSPINV